MVPGKQKLDCRLQILQLFVQPDHVELFIDSGFTILKDFPVFWLAAETEEVTQADEQNLFNLAPRVNGCLGQDLGVLSYVGLLVKETVSLPHEDPADQIVVHWAA